MTAETRTAFREDRQFGESYADNEQVYRTIGITNAQLQRLPMWTRLAIARADAAIIRRDNTITDLLAALEAVMATAIRPTKLWNETPAEFIEANRAYEMAIDKAIAAIDKATGAR